MSFIVAHDCVRLGLRAAAIVFRDVRVGAAGPDLKSEVACEVAAVRHQFASPAEVRADPFVTAFHAILRKVGVNPRRDQPSIERLLTFALKRGDLPAVNSLVDAYNIVSIRNGLSLGAHDIDKIALPVSLRLLTGTEAFTRLGAVTAEPVTAGEYGYVDALGRVLCRLDVVQADFSKVTADTVNALLIVEGTAAHPPEVLLRGVGEAIEFVTRHCGGMAQIVADPGEPGRG